MASPKKSVEKSVGKSVEAVQRTVDSLGDYLREQRLASRLSLRQLAEQAGVSNPYLSQIERGLRRPSADVLQQLAKALRISAEQLYVRAGLISPDTGEAGSVELAVLRDAELTERQKHTLLDVYAAFLEVNGANEHTSHRSREGRAGEPERGSGNHGHADQQEVHPAEVHEDG